MPPIKPNSSTNLLWKFFNYSSTDQNPPISKSMPIGIMYKLSKNSKLYLTKTTLNLSPKSVTSINK